jgi:hypothetical protein
MAIITTIIQVAMLAMAIMMDTADNHLLFIIKAAKSMMQPAPPA